MQFNAILFSLTGREVQRVYDKSTDWIMAVGPRIILAIIVLFIGIWLIRLVRVRVSSRIRRKDVHSTLRPFFEGLVYTALYVALGFLIMQILGIQLTVFAAVIAAFGAAAGLALSGTLQNFASGVLILLLKPFRTGDNIVAQNFEGTVESIQIFYTVVQTFDNRSVIFPNSKLSNEVIVNITRQGIRRLDIELKFKHTQDIDELKKILASAFHDFPETQNEPAPRIGITSIDADGFTLRANVWIHTHGFEDTRMVVNEKIIETLKNAGIVGVKPKT